MTHPGVGALTGLAFVLIIGKVERFPCGKQIASDLGAGGFCVQRRPHLLNTRWSC